MIVHIAVLDVGHGDCSVIYTEDKTSVLVIDCGHGPTLKHFLNQEGIRKIDLALITHNDNDHISGMSLIVRSFPVECLALHLSIRNASNEIKDDVNDLIDAINEHNPNVAQVSTSDVELKEALNSLEFSAQILYPNNRQILRSARSNTLSGVIRIEHNNTTSLFSGDLDKDGWEYLYTQSGMDYKLKADIFKFPHHGGRLIHPKDQTDPTVFTNQLINIVHPRYTLISTSNREKWDHPDAGVMDCLRNYNPSIGHRILCTEVTRLCDINFKEKRGQVLQILPKPYTSKRVLDGNGYPCAGNIRLELHPGGQIVLQQELAHKLITSLYPHSKSMKQ
jgi:competence protein ComEC